MTDDSSLAIVNRAPRRLAFVFLLGCAVTSCSGSAEPPESAAAQPIRVRVAPVQRGDMADILAVTGETAALSSLRLASPVAGRITTLSVRPGDHLAKNEVAAQVITFENEAALRGFTLLEETTQPTNDERQLAKRLRKDMGTRNVPLRVRSPRLSPTGYAIPASWLRRMMSFWKSSIPARYTSSPRCRRTPPDRSTPAHRPKWILARRRCTAKWRRSSLR